MTAATADLCDAFSDVQVSLPVWRDYGGLIRFAGQAVTLKVDGDNGLVRAELETPGAGRVLVVDAGGSLQCALVGGQLASLGVQNGWAGIVLHGCVRDTAELGGQRLGVKALASHPRRSAKSGGGEREVPIRFADLTINPGNWIYADEDGLIISEGELRLPES
ncbi:ribonuclease E activity regulator RraA [Deinococcus rubellus]|uniref:4-hydroxy-4-methyl-2-oxoglutarate aldolase n=1 Tax=Deinococcus rubellus TaxID=1889240 RepID=A0ABY5YJG4_9DEIO|nr:ribonuclease E activity regulator RraA [Deinococcus rubellus]UWX64831.1 ribonuclease E activity regulator RraA [Deinococcus rubellus]